MNLSDELVVSYFESCFDANVVRWTIFGFCTNFQLYESAKFPAFLVNCLLAPQEIVMIAVERMLTFRAGYPK